jgi:hypothetical protein
VHVKSLHIQLAKGTGTIRGVRIANPEGYSGADAITLSGIELAIDARSLREQPFRVTKVRVGDSTVHFEIHEDGGSNIERITRHVMHGSGDRGARGEGGADAPRDPRVRVRGRRDLPRRPGAPEPERCTCPIPLRAHPVASTARPAARSATDRLRVSRAA